MLNKSNGRILIVDDDAGSRKLLIRTLSSAGYGCTECDSGVEALNLIRREQPSLLLLDFEMPGLDGAEVLKQLRSDSNAEVAQIPAIMLTGHGGEESEVLCLEAGADDFVTKPINTAVLRARIETQLRLRAMRRQLQQQNTVLEEWRRNRADRFDAARAAANQQRWMAGSNDTGPAGFRIERDAHRRHKGACAENTAEIIVYGFH